MEFETLEKEIIDVLNQKTPDEVETKEVVDQIKGAHQKTPSSQITSAILTLIDNDKVELTQNLCLKLHT